MQPKIGQILGITGHRPQKLYGYDDRHPGNIFVIYAIEDFLKTYQPHKVITGMAQGVDTYAAQWCIKLNIPFIAAIPNSYQDKVWPTEIKKKYHFLLSKAAEIITVSNDDIDMIEALNNRNKWIVDHSDHILGVFGGYTGGTKNCLEYAKEKKKTISIINPGDYYQTNLEIL